MVTSSEKSLRSECHYSQNCFFRVKTRLELYNSNKWRHVKLYFESCIASLRRFSHVLSGLTWTWTLLQFIGKFSQLDNSFWFSLQHFWSRRFCCCDEKKFKKRSLQPFRCVFFMKGNRTWTSVTTVTRRVYAVTYGKGSTYTLVRYPASLVTFCKDHVPVKVTKMPIALQVVRRDSDFSIGISGSSEFKPPAIWWIHGHSKIHLIFNLLFWPTPVVYSR